MYMVWRVSLNGERGGGACENTCVSGKDLSIKVDDRNAMCVNKVMQW